MVKKAQICLALLILGNLIHSIVAYRKNVHVRAIYNHRGINFRLYDIKSITNKEQLDAITINSTSNAPVVIDFQKSACKPCVRIAPQYLELSIKYESSVNFYKVDADSSQDALMLLKQVGIRSVPTFQIWCGGRRIDEIRGAHIDEVEDVIRAEVARNSDSKEVQASQLALQQRLDLAKQLNDLSN